MSKHVAGNLERLSAKAVTSNNSAASFTSPPIIYSIDGRYLFQREAHVINVRHMKTGQILHQCVRPLTHNDENGTDIDLDTDKKCSNLATVTCIALNPYYSLQLFASYEDGRIAVWDYTEERILKVYDVKANIHWMGSSSHWPTVLTLLVFSKGLYMLQEYDLSQKKRGKTYFSVESTESPIVTSQSSFGSEDRSIHWIALAINKSIHVFNVSLGKVSHKSDKNLTDVCSLELKHVRSIASLAIHTSNGSASLAAGDSCGRIVLFRLRLKSEKSQPTIAMPLKTLMHWHAHRVFCLTFGAARKLLLSGGEECVLVLWQLETGRRSFLPRRSGALMAIAPRNDYKNTHDGVSPTLGYAIYLRDNVLFQYNPMTKEQEWQAFGLARSGARAMWTLPNSDWEDIKNGSATPQLIYDPETKTIPLNGRSNIGIIQFYHPYQHRIIQNLHLTERNIVARTEEKDDLVCTMCQQWQFSPCGQFFVTLQSDLVVSHDESKVRHELQQTLRFYQRRGDGSFYLHTTIESPHASHRARYISYSPARSTHSKDLLVSGDNTGEFRIWRLCPAKDKSRNIWRCQAVIHHRPVPITAIKFSADGSLLAIAYGNMLTIWKIETNVLCAVLPSEDAKDITEIHFANFDCPFVALKTSGEVEIWNLLTLQMEWRYTFQGLVWLCVHASEPEFSLCYPRTSENEYIVKCFNFTSVVPKSIISFSLPESDKLWTINYSPTVDDRGESYLLMDTASHIWCLSTSSPTKRTKLSKIETPPIDSEISSLHGVLPTVKRNVNDKRNGVIHIHKPRNGKMKDLFNVPTHILPPVTFLYQPFMDTLLTKRQHADRIDSRGTLSPKDKIARAKADVDVNVIKMKKSEEREYLFDSRRWMELVKEELEAKGSTCRD